MSSGSATASTRERLPTGAAHRNSNGDDGSQARDVDDRRGVGVGLPDGDDPQLVISETAVAGQLASPGPIGAISPTIGL
jgi:hypothetical protein